MDPIRGHSTQDTGMCPHGNLPAACKKCDQERKITRSSDQIGDEPARESSRDVVDSSYSLKYKEHLRSIQELCQQIRPGDFDILRERMREARRSNLNYDEDASFVLSRALSTVSGAVKAKNREVFISWIASKGSSDLLDQSSRYCQEIGGGDDRVGKLLYNVAEAVREVAKVDFPQVAKSNG